MKKHFIIFFALTFFSQKVFCAGDSTQKYVRMMEVVKNGNPAPDFHYISSKNDTVIFSSFRGKIAVLDLWSTECGPCRKESPYYDSLKIKFSGRNVVFISISLDDSKEKWKNFVKEKKLSDIQLWAGGWNVQPAFSYTIFDGKIFGEKGFGSGVPVFVVIGADGKIVDNRAPRPSSGLEKVINDQLELKK